MTDCEYYSYYDLKNNPKAKALYDRARYLVEMFPEDTHDWGGFIELYELADKNDVVLKMISIYTNELNEIWFGLEDSTGKSLKSRLVYDPYDNELNRRFDEFELERIELLDKTDL